MECYCNIDPAGYADGDFWAASSTSEVHLPESTNCCECRREIKPSEETTIFIGIPSDRCAEVVRYDTCPDCMSLYYAFFCSRVFEELWDAFGEELSEKGPDEFINSNLAKLTPVARERACKMIEEYICVDCGDAVPHAGGWDDNEEIPLCEKCFLTREEIQNGEGHA